ncbi:GAF domain-containing protein [Rhodococcus aetherivorans]
MSDPQDPARSDRQTGTHLTRTRTHCDRCADLTGVDGAAVAIFASDTTRDLVYATDTIAEQVDELQFTLREGPCLTAYRTSVPEIHPDLADPTATRWPMFTPEVLDLGVRALFAFPLAVGNATNIGVLELYRTRPGPLETEHYRIATGYAAALGPTLVDELDPARTSSPMMDPALFPRGNVHIAAGMLAVQLQISAADALARLQAMAYTQRRRITHIAHDIITHHLTLDPDTDNS